MMLPQRKTSLSPAEYLALERESETKCEYWNGEVFALAGASHAHNLIAVNLTISLGGQMKDRPCEVYACDMRVKVEAHNLYAYPDLVVVCGRPQFEDRERDTLCNPTVLIEVLSASTEAYDRGVKFTAYRSLASLSDYLLVPQDRAVIEHYTRLPDDRWLLTTYTGLDAVARIESIGCELCLSDVFAKVEFPPAAEISVTLRRVKEMGAKYLDVSSLSESCHFTTGGIVIHWSHDQEIQDR